MRKQYLIIILIFTLMSSAPSIAESGYSIDNYVTIFFQETLNRQPSVEDWVYWRDTLKFGSVSGAEFSRHIINSVEFKNIARSNSNYIDILFTVLLERSASTEEQSNWLQQLNAGFARSDMLEAFVGSAEFSVACSRYCIKPHASDPVPVCAYWGVINSLCCTEGTPLEFRVNMGDQSLWSGSSGCTSIPINNGYGPVEITADQTYTWEMNSCANATGSGVIPANTLLRPMAAMYSNPSWMVRQYRSLSKPLPVARNDPGVGCPQPLTLRIPQPPSPCQVRRRKGPGLVLRYFCC